MIKEIDTALIAEAVKEMSVEANKVLPKSLTNAVKSDKENETLPIAKEVMETIESNISAAKELGIPVCQDTGMAVVFLKIGQDVHLVGENLTEAVNRGVREGYTEGLLRKSVVADPILRKNTEDNTPAVIHTEITPGDQVEITVAPKGFGSENMSRIFMLKPADGRDGVINAVLTAVEEAGGNPCPPMVIGVGIGGDFEECAYLSKKALLREVGDYNANPYYEELEKELLRKINDTGIGPQGFGGKTTALFVAVETFPTHIAGLPVAVNIGCHVTRHITKIIK